MDTTTLPRLSPSDQLLCDRLATLAGEERRLEVEFLEALGEFDERKVYALVGYSSAFAYLTGELCLSEASSYRRLTAARLLRRLPGICPFLQDGRTTTTKLCMLKTVLNEENLDELLSEASSLPEKAVEALAAQLSGKEACARPRDSIRILGTASYQRVDPQPTFSAERTPVPTPDPGAKIFPEIDRAVDESAVVEPAASAERPPAPAPVLHSVRMVVGTEFLDLLNELKAALSHTYPDGKLEDVLAHAMRVALKEHEKRSRAQVQRPREAPTAVGDAPPVAGGRHIPAAVRREVWKRDDGACTFVGASGKRCRSKHFLELHHLDPYARDGASITENLTLRCRAHNQLQARLELRPHSVSVRTPEVPT